jgi:hypothetical protein
MLAVKVKMTANNPEIIIERTLVLFLSLLKKR